MNLNIIIACDPLGTIGKKGGLPWPNLPGELKKFRDITMGHVMVMGGRTFESLPMYPNGFPGRDNVVISRSLRKVKDTSDRLHSLQSHFQSLGEIDVPHQSVTATGYGLYQWLKTKYADRTVFVCGGRDIVEILLPYSEAIFLTLVHQCYSGDVRIPILPEILLGVLKEKSPNEPESEWLLGAEEEFDDYTTYKLIRKQKAAIS